MLPPWLLAVLLPCCLAKLSMVYPSHYLTLAIHCGDQQVKVIRQQLGLQHSVWMVDNEQMGFDN